MVMGSVLVLTGRVPTFYLKQTLQAALMGLPGIDRIENHVGVVSCNGLSSEPLPPASAIVTGRTGRHPRIASLHPIAARGAPR